MNKISLGPGSALWEKGQKIGAGPKIKSASEASREVVLGGERVVALSPSPGYRPARFARRYFSYLTPFLPFSPTGEPGPRLEQN